MKKLMLLYFTLLTSLGYGFDLPNNYKLRTFYNYGKIDGFVQIPKGGKNGTTSIERPEFKELGIDDISFPDLKLEANWNNLKLYTELKYKVFDGNSILTKDLISHNKFIPAGSKIDTEHKYIKYNIGVGYNLSKIDRLKFIPIVEFSINDFKYQYSAIDPDNNKISSKRSFGWGQLNIGMDLSYQITEKYFIELNGKYGIEYDSIRKYYDLELINGYEIYKNLYILLGIEYEKLNYRDTQDEKQNFMKHDNILYKIGIEYNF